MNTQLHLEYTLEKTKEIKHGHAACLKGLKKGNLTPSKGKKGLAPGPGRQSSPRALRDFQLYTVTGGPSTSAVAGLSGLRPLSPQPQTPNPKPLQVKGLKEGPL